MHASTEMRNRRRCGTDDSSNVVREVYACEVEEELGDHVHTIMEMLFLMMELRNEQFYSHAMTCPRQGLSLARAPCLQCFIKTYNVLFSTDSS